MNVISISYGLGAQIVCWKVALLILKNSSRQRGGVDSVLGGIPTLNSWLAKLGAIIRY